MKCVDNCYKRRRAYHSSRQKPCGKSNVMISIFIRKSHQKKYLEDISSIFDQVRPEVSYLEFRLPHKPLTPNNIGEALKGPQRQLRKESLCVQYYKNKNASLLSAPIPIKSIPEETKILRSIISTSIMEGGCSDSWKYVARHCVNEISHIQGIYFDQSYSTVAHADSFIINIYNADIHRLTASILDVSNKFQNTNVTIHQIVCFSPPPYYIHWFEKYYPNVPLNQYDGPFCPQFMNESQGKTSCKTME